MCQDPVAARGQDDWSGVGWGECRSQRLTGCVCVCVCVGHGDASFREANHVYSSLTFVGLWLLL